MFDSFCLVDLSALSFRERARKSFGSEHERADHPVRPTVVVASVTMIGARKEMIGVDKIDDIRKLGRGGASIASIARDVGVSEPTVRKSLRGPDLSERPPAVWRAPEPPLPGPLAGLVDSWLLEDRRCWSKYVLSTK